MEKLTCTAPGCEKSLPPEALWLPERKALAAANGGKAVAVSDYPRFALCGRHGHLLRKEGVRVYRFVQSVEHGRKEESERKDFVSFAARFVAKTDQKPKPNGARKPDFSGVGMGLSRCAKKDAQKRLDSKQSEAPKPDTAPALPA